MIDVDSERCYDMKSIKVTVEETENLQKVWNNFIQVAKPPSHYNSTQKVEWLSETVENFLNEKGLKSISTKAKVGFMNYKKMESYLRIIDKKKWMLTKIKLDV